MTVLAGVCAVTDGGSWKMSSSTEPYAAISTLVILLHWLLQPL